MGFSMFPEVETRRQVRVLGNSILRKSRINNPIMTCRLVSILLEYEMKQWVLYARTMEASGAVTGSNFSRHASRSQL